MHYQVTKRILDIVCACVGMSIVFIPILVVCLISLVAQGRPILFLQRRTGKGGSTFTILKFRTMNAPGDLFSRNTIQVTPWGRFLRRTKFDEILQLLNVIAGHMSLVGPRPLPVEYEAFLDPRHKARYRVRPGMTGMAQVKGGNRLTWPERFEWDIFYTRNMSLFLDLRILLNTLPAIVGSEAEDSQVLSPAYNRLNSPSNEKIFINQ